MTAAIVATAVGIAGFIFVGVVLGRQSKNRKREAMESLREEQMALASVNIFNLVEDEVTDLGLRDIDGADGVPPDVLLKSWRDGGHSEGCDRSMMRYVVADGIEPAHAGLEAVTIECGDHRAEIDNATHDSHDDASSHDTTGH